MASAFLVVIGLVVLQNAKAGTLGQWFAAKAFNRGEIPPALATAGGVASGSGGKAGGVVGAGGLFGDPLPTGRFMSGWGAPRDGGNRSHKGVDIGAPAGTPLVAVADGSVYYSQLDRGNLCGHAVSILHASGWRSTYCHLSRLAGLKRGEAVRRGQVVGFVGSSGNASSSSPHVHFELRKDGQVLDPQKLIGR